MLPDGRGRVNQAGLDFYERLVDTLLEHGIQPMATLYHWDLPAALDDRGGWLNPRHRRLVRRLRTASCSSALDDRVTLWATLNEPWVVTDGGYLHGALAPGHRNRFEAPIASHHLLRAHGEAVQAYRAVGSTRSGSSSTSSRSTRPSHSASDLAATARADAYMNRQYLDPVMLGALSRRDARDLRRGVAGVAGAGHRADPQPIDFLGINYYTRNVVQNDDKPRSRAARCARSRRPTPRRAGRCSRKA